MDSGKAVHRCAEGPGKMAESLRCSTRVGELNMGRLK